MAGVWANEFREILPTLQQREDLRGRVLGLIAHPMAAKSLEGGDRLDRFRAILRSLVSGEINLATAARMVEQQLPRHGSRHARNNHVFCRGWAERDVRTAVSMLYNRAVLEHLQAQGERGCFVPHSREEDRGTPCTRELAGREHSIATLLTNLVAGFEREDWSERARVPHHPHCSHVVRPVAKAMPGEGPAVS